MTVTEYSVSGLTCGHCVSAVSSELGGLDGVTAVAVDLVAGGNSTVAVTSDAPVPTDQISQALEEAGDFQLVEP